MERKPFFTEGEWQIKQANRNYSHVFKEIQKKYKGITAKQIEKNLRIKLEADLIEAPTLKTVYNVLKKMIQQKIVRKEKDFFIFTPHEILRNKWLGFFDDFFRDIIPLMIPDTKLIDNRYTVDDFLNKYAFIITPKNKDMHFVKSKKMKVWGIFVYNNLIK